MYLPHDLHLEVLVRRYCWSVGCKLIYSFMQRIHTSENALIQAIVQRDKFEDSVVNREWTKALYKGHKYKNMLCYVIQYNFQGQLGNVWRTLPRQWSLITISQDNHSFHPMFPTDHCRLVSIFRLKVRGRAQHVYTRITDTCRLT